MLEAHVVGSVPVPAPEKDASQMVSALAVKRVILAPNVAALVEIVQVIHVTVMTVRVPKDVVLDTMAETAVRNVLQVAVTVRVNKKTGRV